MSGKTTCGYCERELTAYLEPDSPTGVGCRCEPCQPKLAAIKTPSEWALFQQAQARAIKARNRRKVAA